MKFAKMQGVGNDFVVVSHNALAVAAADSLALALCERRFSIGADGLLIVGPSSNPRAAYSFAMRNPDGTPDMCGNGMRCAALYAHRVGLVTAEASDFLVETQDGLLPCHLLEVDPFGLAAIVQVQMAVPALTAARLPFTGQTDSQTVIDFPLSAGDECLAVTSVNTGSTHTVAFRDQLPPDAEFFAVSRAVEHHPEFPERTSLIWTRQAGRDHLEVRIWERGAGETLGCGTGACAAAVAAILTGRAAYDSDIAVTSRGGTVHVRWSRRDAPVILTGPAVWVFSGETNVKQPRAF